MEACVEDPVEFSAVLGIAPGDLHLFDCTTDGDPPRIISNASDDWIRPTIEPRQLIPTTVPLPPNELDVGGLWKSLP